MKTLIVEDDFTSRLLLQEILKGYGATHVAVNGREAVEAARAAMEAGEPYNLICMDVMMPVMDGYEALKEIRGMEEAPEMRNSAGAKIIMTTALDGTRNVIDAFQRQCDAYLIKPIAKPKLLNQLRMFGLIA